MQSLEEVVARVRKKIRLLHYALSTEDTYCSWVARYYTYCLTLPATWTPEQKAEEYLSYLARERRISARSQDQAFASILFLYKEVLGRPLAEVDPLRAKRPSHQRVAPSRDQVRQMREAIQDTPNTPARLLFDLLYGCGLRVSEPLELRIKDILWDEGSTGQLMIRCAKGGKDRRVPLPRCCVDPMKRQIERARIVWEADRRDAPHVGVVLPHSLAKKYPQAPFHWQWFWVFPAPNHCTHPREGTRVRYHLLVDSLQRVVYNAAKTLELEGVVTPHCLRHAYATHSREPIDALRQLLGHSSIETTAGYRHPVIEQASNPLDDLLN